MSVSAAAQTLVGNNPTLASNEALGLTQQEVAERVARGEVNKAPGGTDRSYLEIIRQNVFTFINIMLFAIGVVLIMVGRLDDALVTVGVVLVNVVVGVVQEARAKQKEIVLEGKDAVLQECFKIWLHTPLQFDTD